MIQYPAKIVYDRKDRAYLVEFPDLPGCVTFGSSLQEAVENAREALSGYLESVDSRKIEIPAPRKIKGTNVHYIAPERNVAFAIWLQLKRKKQGMTQQQIAERLKISYQTYQRFEDPAKSNPTLKTIAKLEEVLDEELLRV